VFRWLLPPHPSPLPWGEGESFTEVCEFGSPSRSSSVEKGLVGGTDGIKLKQLMKRLRAKVRVGAFTLIELVVVILLIGLLAAMLLPRFTPAKQRAMAAVCMNNQKQIAVGFAVWASDNNNKLPWQVSTNDDGTKEFVSDSLAVSQFQPLLNITKNSQIFFCYTDKAKSMAPDNQSLSSSNVSYFVDVDATLTNGAAILTGDRHLQAGKEPVKPGLFVYTNGMVMGWTRELHPTLVAGMMSFMDGHVECVATTSPALTTAFNRQNVASERLLVP